MYIRGLIVLAATALACKRAPVTIKADDARPPAPSLLARYPIRRHVAWNESRQQGQQLTVLRREETWTPAKGGWEVRTVTLEAFERDAFTRRYVLGNDGLAYDSTQFSDGAPWLAIDPPKVVLSLTSKTWSAEHALGAARQRRRCELSAFTDCTDGVVVSCTTAMDNSVDYVERTKYCGGVGKVAFEEIIGGSERRWSDELRDVVP